jgi:uncharacterized damage-inducible protein DinB
MSTQLTELLTKELKDEAATTRRVVEVVPDGLADWKPHEKSMAFGQLANLVARMPGWIAMMIDDDELDLSPPGGSDERPKLATTGPELTAALDDELAKSLAALSRVDDERLLTTNWRLLVAGNVVAEATRYENIRSAINHLAHHRGQLSVYYRLNDIPVPSIYGPTADDQSFG